MAQAKHYIEWEGEHLSLSSLCRRLKLDYRLVLGRLTLGWSVEDAVRTPAQEIGAAAVPVMDGRLREGPIDEKEAVPPSVGMHLAGEAEVMGCLPAQDSAAYFAIIHPDGTVIYHMGPEGWLRA